MKLISTDANGGTLFVNESVSQDGWTRTKYSPKPVTKAKNTRPRLNTLAEKFRAALTPELRDELAATLTVTAGALDALSVGWATAGDLTAMRASGAGWQENRPAGAFVFPERDGAGRLVGFSFRASDGRKGAPSSATGSKRGLTIPTAIHATREPVLIVEGATDVAACIVLGLAAVGRPSNSGGAEHLAILLKNRAVLIVGENDPKSTGAWPGRDGAERIATRLATSLDKSVSWTLTPHGAKDVRAWLAARVANGLDLADDEACRAAGQSFLAVLRTDAYEAKPEKGPTVAEQLVRLALELFRFGRTDKDEAFAVALGGPNLAIMLKGSSDALRARLAREFRTRTGKTPGSSALADALNVLTGEAIDAEPERIHLRLAAHGDSVVIDLGDADGRAIIVRPGAWEILERSPVLFRRTALTAALPAPESGGTLDELRELLNVADDSWPLILGWLVATLLPEIPHAILLLSGLQGTGKSSAARVLVTLVDPSPAPLRSELRDMDQWQVSAAGSWAVCLDNLSSIPPWLADALCRAATGDGLVKRKLYSDGDLAVLAFRRVIVLTSIDPGALRGDLGERLLLADLEPIPESERRTEQELDALFAHQRPHLFGALLDAVAAVMVKLPDVRPGRLPRMADFGRVLAAADAAGVTHGALERFAGQRDRIAAEVIDSDPFGAPLLEFIRSHGKWEGTASELLADLLPAGADKPPQGWPKRNGVAGRIKRLTPALAAEGVSATFDRGATPKRRRLIRLGAEMAGKNIVHNVHSVQTPAAEGSIGDDVDEPDDVPVTLSSEVAGDARDWGDV